MCKCNNPYKNISEMVSKISVEFRIKPEWVTIEPFENGIMYKVRAKDCLADNYTSEDFTNFCDENGMHGIIHGLSGPSSENPYFVMTPNECI